MLDCGVARSSQQQSALRAWLLQPLQVSVCPLGSTLSPSLPLASAPWGTWEGQGQGTKETCGLMDIPVTSLQ